MSEPLTLAHTHPRLGKALYAERYSHIDGKRWVDVAQHDMTKAACSSCGKPAVRHEIKGRIVAGPNTGSRAYWAVEDCGSGHRVASNYRRPWEAGR